MATATYDETGGSSTDPHVDESPSQLEWTFSRAIEVIRDMGPEYAEKHLTLTWKNMTVLGDPVGDSLVDTVWSCVNPLEYIQAIRHNKHEPRVSIDIPRDPTTLTSIDSPQRFFRSGEARRDGE